MTAADPLGDSRVEEGGQTALGRRGGWRRARSRPLDAAGQAGDESGGAGIARGLDPVVAVEERGVGHYLAAGGAVRRAVDPNGNSAVIASPANLETVPP